MWTPWYLVDTWLRGFLLFLVSFSTSMIVLNPVSDRCYYWLNSYLKKSICFLQNGLKPGCEIGQAQLGRGGWTPADVTVRVMSLLTMLPKLTDYLKS